MKRHTGVLIAVLLLGLPVLLAAQELPNIGSQGPIETTTITTTGLLTAHSIRVGTGSTPDVTLGADDVFIEGTLEVDGAARFDGALVIVPDGATTAAGLGFAGNSLTGFSYSGGDVYFTRNGTSEIQFTSSGAHPSTDNGGQLGTASQRWGSAFLAGSLSVGTNPASAGAVRLANNTGTLYARNAANSGDVLMAYVDTSDRVRLGNGSGGTVVNGTTVTVAGLPIFSGSIKATTGDPSGSEGQITCNTFDNACKIYADGAWRTLVSW